MSRIGQVVIRSGGGGAVGGKQVHYGDATMYNGAVEHYSLVDGGYGTMPYQYDDPYAGMWRYHARC